MPETRLPASRRKIDKAGDLVRAWWLDPDAPTELLDIDADLRDAAVLVYRYRVGFQDPLNRVTMGVRSFVKRESKKIIVAQRLKRFPTILGKLSRYPQMKLTRMQDIGGCRAILPGGEREIRGVLQRIKRHWDVRRLDDYINSPKETGYRAIHVAVVRRGRLIEIQLRTPGQQEWAALVDQTSGRLGFMLKDGQGPPELVRYFERAAFAIALQEGGQSPDKSFEREFDDLRKQVREYFRRS